MRGAPAPPPATMSPPSPTSRSSCGCAFPRFQAGVSEMLCFLLNGDRVPFELFLLRAISLCVFFLCRQPPLPHPSRRLTYGPAPAQAAQASWSCKLQAGGHAATLHSRVHPGGLSPTVLSDFPPQKPSTLTTCRRRRHSWSRATSWRPSNSKRTTTPTSTWSSSWASPTCAPATTPCRCA